MSEPWKLPTLEGLAWKHRNSAVEVALRLYLAQLPRDTAMGTTALAAKLAATGEERKVSAVLLKLARWVGPLATHDGEMFIAYGARKRRWQWHGQA